MASIKIEETSKWVAETSSSSLPVSASALPQPGGVEADEGSSEFDAVITIRSEPSTLNTFSWRKFLYHMGYVAYTYFYVSNFRHCHRPSSLTQQNKTQQRRPGFLMCIAYIDPGNLEADLQTGAHTGYSLLWLLLVSTTIGFLLQSLSAKLGVATGRHLAQHCRDRYSGPFRYILWIMAESAIIGSDIQEVIGTALALSLLSGGAIPLWCGVVIAAVSAYVLLFLEKFGVRWLELLFQVFVGGMAVTFGCLFWLADVPYGEVVKGFLIPTLDASSLPTAAALIGSILMPHNLFLHSALVHNRAMPAAARSAPLRDTLRYYNIEAAAALLITLGINTSVISVFSRGFYDPSSGHAKEDDIGLQNAGVYLGKRFGWHMQVIWAIGLLAAGQSSTMTGTYAGQYVMSGYLNLRVKPATRALVTRAVAVGPTLLVALYARTDTTKLDQFNQFINILQAVQLPFVLIPLLLFTSDRRLMGIGFANTRATVVVAWGVAAAVMAVNFGTAYQVVVFRLVEQHHVVGMGVGGREGDADLEGDDEERRGDGGSSVVEREEARDLVTPLLLLSPAGRGLTPPLSPAKDIISPRPDSARSGVSSHVIDDISI